jgi:hypothetical protein
MFTTVRNTADPQFILPHTRESTVLSRKINLKILMDLYILRHLNIKLVFSIPSICVVASFTDNRVLELVVAASR